MTSNFRDCEIYQIWIIRGSFDIPIKWHLRFCKKNWNRGSFGHATVKNVKTGSCYVEWRISFRFSRNFKDSSLTVFLIIGKWSKADFLAELYRNRKFIFLIFYIFTYELLLAIWVFFRCFNLFFQSMTMQKLFLKTKMETISLLQRQSQNGRNRK